MLLSFHHANFIQIKKKTGLNLRLLCLQIIYQPAFDLYHGVHVFHKFVFSCVLHYLYMNNLFIKLCKLYTCLGVEARTKRKDINTNNRRKYMMAQIGWVFVFLHSKQYLKFER